MGSTDAARRAGSAVAPSVTRAMLTSAATLAHTSRVVLNLRPAVAGNVTSTLQRMPAIPAAGRVSRIGLKCERARLLVGIHDNGAVAEDGAT
jgi:hypothetical protein